MLCQLRKDPMDEDLEKCDGEYFPCEFCGDPYPVEFIMRHQVSVYLISCLSKEKVNDSFSCRATSILPPFKRAMDLTILKLPEGLQLTWLWQETSFNQQGWAELPSSPMNLMMSSPSMLVWSTKYRMTTLKIL